MQTVERNAKFLSNPTEADLYTAENAILSEDHHEDIRIIRNVFTLFAHFFLFFITNDNKQNAHSP